MRRKKRKKSKKIIITKGRPKSNMSIMGTMRQTSWAFIGEPYEPIIYEYPQEEEKKKKKEKK